MSQIQIKFSTFSPGQYSRSVIQCANAGGISISNNYITTNNFVNGNQTSVSQLCAYDSANPCLMNLSNLINLPSSGFNSTFLPPVIATSSGVQINLNLITTSTTTVTTTKVLFCRSHQLI